MQTLTLTDIATGWTECAPLLVREQKLLTEVLSKVRKGMPFALLGFDTDNDSVFMNETVKTYCEEAGLVFTRCRPYRKNDQAWVEQKNGAVVRRTVGYRRYEGLEAAAALARLHSSLRLFVNFFQPSFKLAGKARVGAKVKKSIIRRPRLISGCWRIPGPARKFGASDGDPCHSGPGPAVAIDPGSSPGTGRNRRSSDRGRSNTIRRADDGAISRGTAHGVAGGRGTSNQQAKREGAARPAAPRIECGHVTFERPGLRRDQFAVLRTAGLYDPDVGLAWEDAEYLATEGIVI